MVWTREGGKVFCLPQQPQHSAQILETVAEKRAEDRASNRCTYDVYGRRVEWFL